jgi:pyruvate,water dikinase
MGLTNVKVMIPFVRTLTEARGVIDLLAEHGLKRGENGLQVIMMCELPSNAVIAEQFLEHFDGFSIGSNDMTQLTLGWTATPASSPPGSTNATPPCSTCSTGHRRLQEARQVRRHLRTGPSDHPDLAAWLLDQHIDTMSLNPDTVVDTWMALSRR